MSSLRAVFFDLDGTLLPMNLDEFNQAYFYHLSHTLAPYGYEPKKLIESVWIGVKAMMKNQGPDTNEKLFWNAFTNIYGEKARSDESKFAKFYENEFQRIRSICGEQEQSAPLVRALRQQGLLTVLATNPIFPTIAVENRLGWINLSLNDFDDYTSYENSTACKPSARYFTELMDRLGLQPEECLMIGNDVSDDMPAKELGMHVFLLTDCLINLNNEDLSAYPHGTFAELQAFLQKTFKFHASNSP